MADAVIVALSGRIDSGNAAQTEEELRSQLKGDSGAAVIFDAEKLDYISSAGLRVLLRLKKTFPDLTVTNVSSEVYEILEMTGFTEIMTVEKAYRKVSVEGCEVIGEGANGRVYRIDHDNVVKTYKNADALSEIQHEREVARLALILGIPTAISYDVVKVGDSYGSVFELLDAQSFAHIISNEPQKFEWCVEEYVSLLKKLHSTAVPDGKLPPIKLGYQRALANIAHLFSETMSKKLTALVDAVPNRDTMIHGDFHTKNIVLADDEVLLIDMDTLSVGHPIFELAQMYNSYVGFGEYQPELIERFQGFSSEISQKFWRRALCGYLGTENEQAVTAVEDKIRCVAYIRLIDWSTRHHDMDVPDQKATRELWISELTHLLTSVDTLDFDTDQAADSNANELEIEATVDNLQTVTGFIDQILESVHCPLKAQMQIDLAAEEIFVNIAHYAYAPNIGKAKISVELSEGADAVSITFTDSGVRYNPLEKGDPDITLNAEERSVGGLGIFMTKKTMDDMTYRYEDGKNILTMTKKLG